MCDGGQSRGGFHKAYLPQARKKYVPSAKQRAEDARLKRDLDHLTGADIQQFEELLDRILQSKAGDGEALKHRNH